MIRSLSSSRSTQAERTLRLQPGILGIGVPLLHLSANAASDTLVTVDTLLVLLLLLLQGIMGRVHTARVGHLVLLVDVRWSRGGEVSQGWSSRGVGELREA